MKKSIRIFIVIILAAAFICVIPSGCTPPQAPLWVAVKSVGGDNGLFAEGQEYNFTLCFGYTSPSAQECQIAVITAKNINNDTAEEENQTIIIDDFNNKKYNKQYKDASAPTLELSWPAPANQPCTGTVEIDIACYKDETAQQEGEYIYREKYTVIYLTESGVGTIIGTVSVDELWKRRCDILLAEGRLTQNEYQNEMHKLQLADTFSLSRRGISAEWTERNVCEAGNVSFIETVDGSGIESGTFSATTDNETVAVSYLSQMDSGWYEIYLGGLYKKYKKVYYLTAETENGVETWFVLYYNGKLTLSRPVSGWSRGITGSQLDVLIISDSKDRGTEKYYIISDDMSLEVMQESYIDEPWIQENKEYIN